MVNQNNNVYSKKLYDNLKALSEVSFPKKCSSCGRVYNSPDDFITRSENVVSGSGLKSTLDDNDTPIIEVFRNCLCGSTLMEEFLDRRDLSEQGKKRRKVFGNIITLLQKKGIPPQQARLELIKMISGKQSVLLENIGITFKSSTLLSTKRNPQGKK